VTVLSLQPAHLARGGFVAVLGNDFSDPTNERLIYLSAVGLFVVGLALLVGTILWWRRGRQEHPALGPLEVLGSRSWTKADEAERRRRIEKARLGGHGVVEDEPMRPEPVDLRELVRNSPTAFDDLREPEPAPPAAAAPAAEVDSPPAPDPDATVAAPRPTDDDPAAVPGANA
jgi:hypothetical protein